MSLLRLCAIWCLTASSACLTQPDPEPLPTDGLQVLFVGNSLTYENDLPATLQAIAASAGETVRVASATGSGLALIDHLNGASNAVAAIQSRHWDFVILQQGPTPSGLCRDTLVLSAKLFDPLIRAAGATPALFMTWPTAQGSQAFFDDVRTSFQDAAREVDGVFLPAGEAWRSAWAANSALPLYGFDGFHPSSMGSFLAALTIYERITGKDARDLPPKAFGAGAEFSLPEATIRLLQAAAHDANSRFPARPNGTVPARAVIDGKANIIC
ncbi:MAG: hypothetical protein HOP28_03990 [Gemmatimonadales bacterium]|nr:hypothetical protein [Gemmatimonadales bacterium]